MSIQSQKKNSNEKAEEAVKEALEQMGVKKNSIDLNDENTQKTLSAAASLMFNNKNTSQESKNHDRITQLGSYFDHSFSQTNKAIIKEVYESFDDENDNPEDLVRELEKKGIHAIISDSFHRKATYKISQKDNAHLVLAYFHNPFVVKVDNDKHILEDFFEALTVPKTWKAAEELSEQKPSKKKIKLSKSGKQNK